MSGPREALVDARRIVVKIGSRALATGADVQARLADEIAEISRNRAVVVVSSGAIALGCERLGYTQRPQEMARLQAAASAGQSVLMRRYDEALGKHGITTAQVLLTHTDLEDRERLNNAREALGALLDAGAVPIVNENDTVATDEIRFGDNDQLAAMVVPLLGAELLVLLTDVEGVLDAAGNRVAVMNDSATVAKVKPTSAGHGSGGMASKLDAAHKATMSGATVVIASALRERVLGDVLAGKDVGTLFPARGDALRARKHWIAFTLKPRGAILVDEGAARAVTTGTNSLLPVGVAGIRGQFHAGDSVQICGPDGREIGRGLSRLGAMDVARAAGKKGAELEMLFGTQGRDVVIVHKDDLVLGD